MENDGVKPVGEKASTQLRAYERHVACGIAAILVALGIAGIDNEKRANDNQKIQVFVVGAAQQTKVEVDRGSLLGDVCAKAELRQDADVSNIDMAKKVTHNEMIVIPVQGRKTFFVKGAVAEPKVVVIEGEVTAKSILQEVTTTEEADVKAFNRRRVFKNGSVIEIKSRRGKKVERESPEMEKKGTH